MLRGRGRQALEQQVLHAGVTAGAAAGSQAAGQQLLVMLQRQLVLQLRLCAREMLARQLKRRCIFSVSVKTSSERGQATDALWPARAGCSFLKRLQGYVRVDTGL